ncbi:MAG: TetR/AcrR family transcriptional regulator [Candidatus Firestonebacteria bacterium]|nr:TetR/AcrR family transcriptional regulator [Candidatus Firestonebacteria bacterium]
MSKILEEKKEQKRRAILKSALNIFSSKGYHNTVIDDIAIQADLGKGTIYRYYKNKQSLFLAVIESNLDEIKRLILSAMSSKESDVIKNMRKYIEIYLKYFEKNKSFYNILLHEKSEFKHEAFLRHRKKQIFLFEPLVQQGINEGKVKHLNSKSLTYALLGMMDAAIWKWLWSPKTYPITDEIPVILEIMKSGILKN